MGDSREVAVRQPTALPAELTVSDVLAQVAKIQDLMAAAMKEGEHYGLIPGTGSKKTLLKAGAEKLCLMFQFAPEYKHEIAQVPFTVISTCTLYHRPSGSIVATGSGMCSSAESKYAWRKADRTCPACGKEGTVIKGRKEFGGGWLCWSNKGGCGSKWVDGDQAIEGQEVGRVANPDVADQYNTVLKMADKRALVAAVLNGTAASDIFTQDIEDIEENLRARKPVVEEPKRAEPDMPVAKAETLRQATKAPKPESATAPSASAVPEAPVGETGHDVITSDQAAALAKEIEDAGLNAEALLRSFAKTSKPAELTPAEAAKVAAFLEKRRALAKKA